MGSADHNPLQVLCREELQLLADLCLQHDVIAVCDEVGARARGVGEQCYDVMIKNS